VHEARATVTNVGYVALSEASYERVLSRFEHRLLGSLFQGRGSTVGVKASDLTAEQ